MGILQLLSLLQAYLLPIAFFVLIFCFVILFPLFFWWKKESQLIRWVGFIKSFLLVPILWFLATRISLSYLGFFFTALIFLGGYFFNRLYLILFLPPLLLGLHSQFNELFWYLALYFGLWGINWMSLFAVHLSKSGL